MVINASSKQFIYLIKTRRMHLTIEKAEVPANVNFYSRADWQYIQNDVIDA
jgi:hypothetical protein